LAWRYDENAELIGIDMPTVRANAGDVVKVTLYWRALGSTERDLLSYLHSTGGEIVRRDSYPATGNLLSTDWQAGDTWAERYIVRIPKDAPPQEVFPLIAGVYDPEAQQAVTAFDANGASGTPFVGRLAINAPATDGVKPQYRLAM